MASVTQRIKQIKQPKGGYVRPRDFEKVQKDDRKVLHDEENIHASIVGIAVDYLTRFSIGTPVEEAFKISLMGASMIGESEYARRLASAITGVDDTSIICACKLAGYDVCFRAGAMGYKPVEDINPDANTISNIRTMVERGFLFFREYGPIIKDGFTFEGGYTQTVNAGDGDFLTEDTLWDFKVSKDGPKTSHTLQLLMYYIMGTHSIHPEFLGIRKLGIYNPRLNAVYTLDISKVSPEIIEEVSSRVIGYGYDGVLEDSVDEDKQIWTLTDLASRYQVGKSTITSVFMEYGLPHYKEGRSYRFVPDDVIDWEIEQREVPYKRGSYILPAYIAYGEVLLEELKEAKKAGDKAAVKRIKKQMALYGYKKKANFALLLAVLLLIGCILLVLYAIYYVGFL